MEYRSGRRNTASQNSTFSIPNSSAPLSVSEFLENINALLTEQVAWVEGEIADLRISQDRFVNFDLKDERALVHCFALKFRIRTPLEDGMQVRVWGVPKVYPKYGRFSLNVEIVEPAGEGALRRAYELLKAKLLEEGLFAPERKRQLPKFPERIGLVTSPDAAAYSDFLKVLKARCGGMEIVFVPVTVQGRAAPAEIVSALEFMAEHADLDALVLIRGGGSLQELHAFNDERVVRALARSRVPTIVGVGHERDVTLCDLVADVRGSTPSNAAELLTPSREELAGEIAGLVTRLDRALKETLRTQERTIVQAVRVLRETVFDTTQHLLALGHRMAAVQQVLARTIGERAQRITAAVTLLRTTVAGAQRQAADAVGSAARVLRALHPHATLQRGYSITRDARGTIVRDATRVTVGDALTTTLHRGTLASIIETAHAWSRNPHSTSRRRSKSSSGSSPRSRQGTLISSGTSPGSSGG